MTDLEWIFVVFISTVGFGWLAYSTGYIHGIIAEAKRNNRGRDETYL